MSHTLRPVPHKASIIWFSRRLEDANARRPGDICAVEGGLHTQQNARLRVAIAADHSNVAAAVKDGVTEQNRAQVIAAIRKHSEAIAALCEEVV